MYTSVRQEILDQKKCQFNLFGASITLTAAVLAYGAATNVGPLVYVTPILLNVLSVTIILDKAISIQRMVGYLQLMESCHDKYRWMWEYQLSIFRATAGRSVGLEGFRRHTYVITVATILFVVNILSAALFFRGPSAIALRASDKWQDVSEFYGAVSVIVFILLTWGVLTTLSRWGQWMFGKFTGEAVRQRWREALDQSQVAACEDNGSRDESGPAVG